MGRPRKNTLPDEFSIKLDDSTNKESLSVPKESEIAYWSKKIIKASIRAGVMARVGNVDLAKVEANRITQEIINE